MEKQCGEGKAKRDGIRNFLFKCVVRKDFYFFRFRNCGFLLEIGFEITFSNSRIR